MKLSNQLRTNKIRLVLKEAEAPAPTAKPYKLNWNGEGYHLKLIPEKDDQGSTFYWPLPVKNPGEGIADPGNEFLVGKDGTNYDYAFEMNDVYKWFIEHVPSSILIDNGVSVDSQNLLDNKQVASWFAKTTVTSKPRALDLAEKPEKKTSSTSPVKPSARFSSAFAASDTGEEGATAKDPSQAGRSARFSKLDLDTAEDKARQEEEDQKRKSREGNILSKNLQEESKKASSNKSKKIRSDAFVEFIIERLKRKI
jgi:hypothetical protein